MRRFAIVPGALFLALSLALGLRADEAGIRHRQEARAALEAPDVPIGTIVGKLSDADPMVRRTALLKLYERDRSEGERVGRRLLNDPAAAVRRVAKAISRKTGQFRDNEAWSMSEQNDHQTIRVATVRPVSGSFVLPDPLPDHEAVELWFGRPNRDLYVWENGTYLGQFDFDDRRGREFRLDATAETLKAGTNSVVIRDAAGAPLRIGFTVEVLKW